MTPLLQRTPEAQVEHDAALMAGAGSPCRALVHGRLFVGRLVLLCWPKAMDSRGRIASKGYSFGRIVAHSWGLVYARDGVHMSALPWCPGWVLQQCLPIRGAKIGRLVRRPSDGR